MWDILFPFYNDFRRFWLTTQARGDSSIKDVAASVIQRQWRQFMRVRRPAWAEYGDANAASDLDFVIEEADANITEECFDISILEPDFSQELASDHLFDSVSEEQDCSNITEDMFVPILRRSRDGSEDFVNDS